MGRAAQPVVAAPSTANVWKARARVPPGRPFRGLLHAGSTPQLVQRLSRLSWLRQQIEELLRHRVRREWILSGHQIAVNHDVRAPRVRGLGVFQAESLQLDLEDDRQPSIDPRVTLHDLSETCDTIH